MNRCFNQPGGQYYWLAPGKPQMPMHPQACRQVCFWPCFGAQEIQRECAPKVCCQKCGCCELERQGRFVRCCKCGWIGIFEECLCACKLRDCCDNVLWPQHLGWPR